MNSVQPITSVGPMEDDDSVFNRNKVQSRTASNDLEDLSFPGETFVGSDDLKRCISPILTCMKLCGAYFHHRETVTATADTSREKAWRLYSMIILAYSWFNGVRVLLLYSSNDGFDSKLILKIALSALQILCAILHTSYFFASESGRLDSIIKSARLTPKCIPTLRKLTVCYLCVAFACIATLSMFFSYLLFTTNGSFDFMMTPFVIYIPVDSPYRNALRVIYIVGYFFSVPSWFLPHVMNHIITAIIYRQFSLLNRRFVESIGLHGQFNEDLAKFRRRHQSLSLTVKQADSFFMLGNVSNFVFHAVTVIILLFALVFCEVWDTVLHLGYWLFCVVNVGCLLWTIVDGIMVNHHGQSCTKHPHLYRPTHVVRTLTK